MTEPLPPTGLDIEAVDRNGHVTLHLRGELDIASVPSLEAAVARVPAESTSALTLDLSGLLFIDSTGLAAIVLAGKLCERSGYEFVLVPGPSAVQRLFELTGLIDVLPFLEADLPSRNPEEGSLQR
ncbi:MAG TPA: STAS domain-containing protein [Solirubrobacteraceae bacterium]|jgi:anti-anti-sigma factor|nr:STAS domain-containing protein [Solirubrobacteraceae bacterium]